MDKITASVGHHCANCLADNILIQTLLNAYHLPGEMTALSVDGKVGNKTIERIKVFQKTVLEMAHPDGCIDPNGKTFIALAGGVKKDHATHHHVSKEGISLLKSIEKLACKPYDDQTGKAITSWVKGATIGYGHLISSDDWHKYKNGITQSQALELFDKDLTPYVNTINDNVSTCVSQNEFDAMLILTYNIGITGFCHSSVLKLINDPCASTSYACLNDAWKAWNKSQGEINQGLMNRREAELDIYNKGVYHTW